MPLSSRPLIVCLLALAALAGCDRKSLAPEQGNVAASDAGPANAAAPDEVTAAPGAPPAAPASHVDRSHKGEAAPAAAFETLDGKPTTLARYAGKPLLVNLWATWCAPCLKEMPTLDKLAAGGAVRVLPVSQDLDGAAKVRPYLARARFAALQPALDPKLALSTAYQANLPLSILYDSAGKEVWRYMGSLDWTGAEAKGLMTEAK